MIYLDHAATTRISPKVLEAMMPYLSESFGNPNSTHPLGRVSYEAIERSRCQVADFLHTDPEHIIFTSGGSEANNLAIRGVARYLKSIGRTKILVNCTEHESVLRSAAMLIKDGFDVQFLPVNRFGAVEVSSVMELLDDKTGLVSVMLINNELGTENPVFDICELAHEAGALFHTDCVQAAGCRELNVGEMACDFLTISGHKIYGPKGAGVLYAANTDILEPLICGSDSQEFGLRGGTQNVPAIVGMGQACEELVPRVSVTRVLKNHFYYELTRRCDGIHKNAAANWSHILSLRFDDVDASSLSLLLGAKGICVSTGSACSSNQLEPSHVLKAIGLSDVEAWSTVRFSFSPKNTLEEAFQAAEVVAECVNNLRAMGGSMADV